MRQILLICAVMVLGCQRLRLEVDDLRLRCGEDANLVDVAQWVEPFSDYGKPPSDLIKAALIRDDLTMERLPVSSKGCVAIPANAASWRWLVVRSEGGGSFGQVLEASPELYRRVQLGAIPKSFPRFDCPSGASSSELPIKINYSDRWAAENLILDMDLVGEKGEVEAQLKLELAKQEGDTQIFDLSPIKEGKFEAKIKLISLLDIHNNLKGFERNCPLRIDRTAPKAKIVLRNGREALLDGPPLRLNPGEAIEVSSSDATSTKVLSCWSENKAMVGPCSNFVEAGSRLSAPSEGEWTLLFTVVDEAGNKTPLKEVNVAIFDADRVGRIVEWIELAKAYLKEDNNYDALQQIYRAARAMSELKAKSEWEYIRNRLRVPFLKLLPRTVPMQRVQNEEGILDKIWATSDTTFLTHSFGERRWGHIVKQFDLNGKLLKRLQFDEKAVLAFDPVQKKLLVWKPENALEIYDPALKQENTFLVKVNDDEEEKSVLSFTGAHAVIRKDGGWFYINTIKESDTALADVDKDGKGVAISFSGKWLVYRNGDGLAILDLNSGITSQKAWPNPVDELRFARSSDLLCVKAAQTLRCGQPQDVLVDKYILDSKDAQGKFAMDESGQFIGVQGTRQIYELDRKNGTFYFYPFLKKVLDLYYNNNGLRVYSPEGTEYVASLPREPLEPKPFNPDFVPKRLEYWTDNENIFYSVNDFYVGKFNVIFRKKDGTFKGYGTVLDPRKINLTSLTLLPSRNHFVAITGDQQAEVYPIDGSLQAKFSTPCTYVAPSADSCVYEAEGKSYFARLEDKRHFAIKKPIEIPQYYPAEMLFWHPKNSQRFAGFDQNRLLVWDFSRGKADLIFQAEAPGNLYQANWVTDRWIAASGENNYLAIWDVESQAKIFETSGQYDYMSQFDSPVDFAPVPGVFAAVGKDENGTPVLELWKKGVKEAYARHIFQDPDMEWAQVLRFDKKSNLLLIAFHHGYVYLIKNVSEPLKPDNITLLQSHEDAIMSMDFKEDGRTAYSISADGSIVEHDLFGKFYSRQIVKAKASNAGGWLEEDGQYWLYYPERTLSFFDRAGKQLESAENLVDVSLNSSRITIGGMRQKNVIIDWKRFDVWQQLCEWSPLLLETTPDDAEHWKNCKE